MNKRNIVFLVLSLCLALILAGCGGQKASVQDEVNTQPVMEEPEDTVPEAIVLPESEEEVKAVKEEIRAEVKSEGTCVDTDGGLNYEEAGMVVEGKITEEDTCSGSSVYTGRLYEEYCDEDGKHARMTYDCPSGVCEDGACV